MRDEYSKCHPAQKMRVENLLSEWPLLLNYSFLLFLLCFFICLQLFGNRRKLLTSMFYNVFRSKDRQNIFLETVNNEIIIKILLCFQTLLLLSLASYSVYCHFFYITLISVKDWLFILGIFFGAFLVWMIYKFIFSNVVGIVFFSKESLQLWNSYSFSIWALGGLALYLPVMCMYFIPNAFTVCLLIIALSLLLMEGLAVYKIYTIFFHRNSNLLYFILYLCTRELMSLFWLYEALKHFVQV